MIKLNVFKGLIFGLLLLLPNTVQARSSDSYAEVGLVYTMLLQPTVGYWWGDYGVRVTGMYQDEAHNEYHLNIGYLLSDDGDVQHAVNLLTSWIVGSDAGANYDYAATGIAYSINYYGFFVELGLAIPWRDNLGNLANDPVVPCGKFGYIYRFD
ncbi:MAG: hypothetical protein OEW60_00900 [Thiovulaceae bacterium]|nr:hypothetical protein [Sulfurimonadaceae bacterium]